MHLDLIFLLSHLFQLCPSILTVLGKNEEFAFVIKVIQSKDAAIHYDMNSWDLINDNFINSNVLGKEEC